MLKFFIVIPLTFGQVAIANAAVEFGTTQAQSKKKVMSYSYITYERNNTNGSKVIYTATYKKIRDIKTNNSIQQIYFSEKIISAYNVAGNTGFAPSANSSSHDESGVTSNALASGPTVGGTEINLQGRNPGLVCMNNGCAPSADVNNYDPERGLSDYERQNLAILPQAQIEEQQKKLDSLKQFAPNLDLSQMTIDLPEFNDNSPYFPREEDLAAGADLVGQSLNSAHTASQFRASQQYIQDRSNFQWSNMHRQLDNNLQNSRISNKNKSLQVIDRIAQLISSQESTGVYSEKFDTTNSNIIHVLLDKNEHKLLVLEAENDFKNSNYKAFADKVTLITNPWSGNIPDELKAHVGEDGIINGDYIKEGALDGQLPKDVQYRLTEVANTIQAANLGEFSASDSDVQNQIMASSAMYLISAKESFENGHLEEGETFIKIAKYMAGFTVGAITGAVEALSSDITSGIMLADSIVKIADAVWKDPSLPEKFLTKAIELATNNPANLIKKMSEEQYRKLMKMSAYERAKAIGNITGNVGYEIITIVSPLAIVKMAKPTNIISRALKNSNKIQKNITNALETVAGANKHNIMTKQGAEVYATLHNSIETLPNGLNVKRIREGTDKAKIAIIGRNMPEVVDDAAAHLRRNGVQVETFESKSALTEMQKRMGKYNEANNLPSDTWLPNNEIMKTELLKRNREWAQKLVDEGYTVLDLGNTKNYVKMSPFYALEKKVLFGK